MGKQNLRLVWNNPNPQKEKSLFKKFTEWLTEARGVRIEIPKKLRWWKTTEEKEAILEHALTQAFGDYDYTTNDVNIYPAIRAKNAVREMVENDTLEYYFKRWELTQEHLKKLNKIKAEFERKRA